MRAPVDVRRITSILQLLQFKPDDKPPPSRLTHRKRKDRGISQDYYLRSQLEKTKKMKCGCGPLWLNFMQKFDYDSPSKKRKQKMNGMVREYLDPEKVDRLERTTSKVQTTSPVKPRVLPTFIKPGQLKNKQFQRRTGFVNEKVFLAYVAIICNGSMERIQETQSLLTWYEEWFIDSFGEQDRYADVDLVDEKKKPFHNIFDKGYRLILAAWQHGKQIVQQPIFAKSDQKFRKKEVVVSASVAADRSGNERGVAVMKRCGFISRGLAAGASPKRLNDAWMSWSFQANFMYEAVL